MGYHWFESQREYRIFLTENPSVFEGRSSHYAETCGERSFVDYRLMNEAPEPLPGIPPMLRQYEDKPDSAEDIRDFTLLEQAAKQVELQAEKAQHL